MHAVVARSTFPSQNVQNTCVSEHVWKLRCRKVDAVVARSTFRSQHVQNTSVSEQIKKVKLRKNTRRYGANRISKLKYTKYTMFGPFLDVQMSFRVAGMRDCAPCQK